MTKGKGQSVFSQLSAEWKGCEEEQCFFNSNGYAKADVHELSVGRDDYLGLDMTDAMKGKMVTRTVTANIDPQPDEETYEWKGCGVCKFKGEKNGRSVVYGATSETAPSKSYLAEKLMVEATVKKDDMTASATCTTNFTVVKVDVTIGGVGEDEEESTGAFVKYAADAANGLWTAEGTNSLVAVSITCEPKNLPEDEEIVISAPEKSLYAKFGEKYYAVSTNQTVSLGTLKKLKFFLHGDAVSGALRDKQIKVRHEASEAVDLAKFTVCRLELITPSGDPVNEPKDSGEGQNEFTFSAASPGVLTMDLKAKVSPCAAATNAVFSVEDIGCSQMKWDDANPGGKATVSGDILMAKVTFTGLPEHNSDFGKKTASIICGNASDSSVYEVFFAKFAVNHPQNDERTANWFHYWKEASVCGIAEDCTYGGGMGMVITGLDDDVTVTGMSLPDYVSEANSVSLFDSCTLEYGKLLAGGSGQGIQCVAETIQHERHHIFIRDTYGEQCDRGEDRDGDGIPDSVEEGLDGIRTSRTNADTYHVESVFPGLNYYTYGDDEIRCRKAEMKLEIDIFPEKDWANPGCQSLNLCGPRP